MKLLKPLSLSGACMAALLTFSQAAPLVTFNIDSGSRSLRDNLGVPLTVGNPSLNGDGAILQIGYYSTATIADNFSGTFIPLTGAGSLFGVVTTIGDTASNGPSDGEIFTDPINLFGGTNGGVNDGLFPAPGTPLSIRLFNSTTLGGATFTESISNDLWLWQTPANAPSQPIINLFLGSAGLTAKSGASVSSPSANVGTNTPVVPEPTSAALMMVGLLSLAARRRRQVT
jgi:hypothetical protein